MRFIRSLQEKDPSTKQRLLVAALAITGLAAVTLWGIYMRRLLPEKTAGTPSSAEEKSLVQVVREGFSETKESLVGATTELNETLQELNETLKEEMTEEELQELLEKESEPFSEPTQDPNP